MKHGFIKVFCLTCSLIASHAYAADLVVDTTPHTITGSSTETYDSVDVSGSQLQVEDSSNLVSNGNFDVSGGAVEVVGTSNVQVNGVNSSLSVSSGDLSANDSEVQVNGKDATLSGGSVTLGDSSLKNNGTGNLSLSGSDVNATNSQISQNGTGDLNVSAGTVNLDGSSLSSTGAGKLEISGGSVNVNNNSSILKDNTTNGGDLIVSGSANITMDNSTMKVQGAQAGDLEVTDGALSAKNGSSVDFSGNGNVNIAGGNVKLDSSNLLYSGQNGGINITGGTVELDNAAGIKMATDGNIVIDTTLNLDNGSKVQIEAGKTGDININSNADLTLSNNSAIINSGTGDINVSGGKIDLSSSHVVQEGQGNISISNGADVSMSGGSSIQVSGANTTGTISIDGSALNVSGSDNHIITSDNQASIDVNNSVINIAQHADLILQQNNTGDKVELDIDTSTLNMSGSLSANVKGGDVNFKDETAQIEGDVVGSDITFEATNNLSNYITGNISGGTITVAQNVMLNFDKYIDVSDIILESQSQAAIEQGIKSNVTLNTDSTLTLYNYVDGNVSGAGNLIFQKGAVVNGNVSDADVSFAYNSRLSSAITGTITGGSLSISNGVLLTADKTFDVNLLNVKGSLDIGTQQVKAKSVVFADGSTLGVRIAGTNLGQYGQISGDSANISTLGTTLKLTVDSGVLSKGDSYTFNILDAASVNGAFKGIEQNGRYNILDNKDGSYTVSYLYDMKEVISANGGDQNNLNTANAWDNNVDFAPGTQARQVADRLNELSQGNTSDAKELVDSMTALAPDVAPVMSSQAVELNNQIFSAVGNRFVEGVGSKQTVAYGTSASSNYKPQGRYGSSNRAYGALPTYKGRAGAYNGHNVNGISYPGSYGGGRGGLSSGDFMDTQMAVWTQGLFNKSELSSANGFEATSNGAAIGIENIGYSGKIGVGYAYNKTDVDSTRRTTDIETHAAMLYAQYKPADWYVNAILTYGWSQYNENKNVGGIGVTADYDVYNLGAQLMGGYEMKLANSINFIPELGVRYTNIMQDEYTDSAGQRVESSDANIITAVLGAKLNKEYYFITKDIITKPELRAALTYDVLTPDNEAIVTASNGTEYMVSGDSLDRLGLEAGASLTAEINKTLELSIGYDGRFKSDYTNHTGMVSAKYKF